MANLLFLIAVSVVLLPIGLFVFLMLFWAFQFFLEYVSYRGQKILTGEEARKIINANIPFVIRNMEGRCTLDLSVAISSQDKRLLGRGCEGRYSRHSRNTENWGEIILKRGTRAKTCLHEYGHFVDDLFDDDRLVLRNRWLDVWRESKRLKSWIFFRRIVWYWGRYHEHPVEFFAECFFKFYISSRGRERLKKLFPAAHAYFEEFEERATKQ